MKAGLSQRFEWIRLHESTKYYPIFVVLSRNDDAGDVSQPAEGEEGARGSARVWSGGDGGGGRVLAGCVGAVVLPVRIESQDEAYENCTCDRQGLTASHVDLPMGRVRLFDAKGRLLLASSDVGSSESITCR